MTNTIVAHNDFDGIVSTYILQKYFKLNAKICFTSYKDILNILPQIDLSSNLYLIDISLNNKIVNFLNENHNLNLFYFDHHISSQDYFSFLNKKKLFISNKENICTAEIVLKTIKNEVEDKDKLLIKAAHAFDFLDINGLFFQQLYGATLMMRPEEIYSIIISNKIWNRNYIKFYYDKYLNYFIYCKKNIKNIKTIRKNNINYIFVETLGMTSDLLLEMLNGQGSPAIIFALDKSIWGVSVRCNKGYCDIFPGGCQEIAKYYMGGGHTYAAGFKLNNQQYKAKGLSYLAIDLMENYI